MPRLYLAQMLCPQRHALFALAYDGEVTAAAEVERQMHAVLASGALNPWCGLCASRELRIEHGKLATDDWAVALAGLRAGEAANLATRAHFDRLKGNTN